MRLSVLVSLVLAAATAAATPTAVPAIWQHHKVTFGYFGITTLYTCDGLENKVKRILRVLGARNDLKVRATGCPGPVEGPSRSAWVTAEFDAPSAAGAAGTFTAAWLPVKVTPRNPNFMGDGDCELIEDMRHLITQNFTLQDLDYRTACTPHELYPDGFAVSGVALEAQLPASR